MNNKFILICESIYNDYILKLAKTMVENLDFRCLTTDKALVLNFDGFQTIQVGSGIYIGKRHSKIFVVVEKLDFSQQEGLIFSSKGNSFLGKYHQPLKNVLVEKKKKIIDDFKVRGCDEKVPWIIFDGAHRGKPDEKDLKKAIGIVIQTIRQLCIPDYYLQVEYKLPIQVGEPKSDAIGTKNSSFVLICGEAETFNHNNCTNYVKNEAVFPLGIIANEKSKALSKSGLDCSFCKLYVKNCMQRPLIFKTMSAMSLTVA